MPTTCRRAAEPGRGYALHATARNPRLCNIDESAATAAKRSKCRLLLQVARPRSVLDAGLSGHAVAEAVKRACRRVGLDAGEYSGHSMRAGAGDERCGDGVAELDVARTSRHKRVSTSRTYVREAQLFSRNAAAAVPWRELRARCSRCSATVRWAVALRASVTRTRIALGVLSWGLST